MRIDFHRHLFDRPEELDILLGDMERHHIDKTLLLPLGFDARFMGCGMHGNAGVLKAVRKHPDRLMGAVYVDPREADVIETIERYLGEGFVAFKMWPPVGFYPDDKAYFHVYERIAETRLPLIVHTGYTDIAPLGAKRPAPYVKCSQMINFDLPISMFPEIPFLLAHCGDPDFDLAMMICGSHANVYFNPIYAADTPWDGRITLHWEAQGRIFPMPFDRMIWGSDNIDIDHVFGTWEDFYTRNGHSDLIDGFYGGTATRLLQDRGIAV